MTATNDCPMCGEGQRPDARPCEECRPVLDAEIDRLSREPLRVEQVVEVDPSRGERGVKR